MTNYLSCLFCDGYKYRCKEYAPIEDRGELCAWYDTLSHDLEKIGRHNNEPITFGELERVLKDDKP
jgi:hypothetical protein